MSAFHNGSRPRAPIDIVLSTSEAAARPEVFDGRTVVVIDVLRATSSATTALSNGAAAVLAVAEVEEASATARALGGQGVRTLLGGERGGLRIDGFDCGNSPREYTTEVTGGKVVILTTTNGTKAVSMAAPRASELYICCFLDVDSLVAHLARTRDRRPSSAGVVFFASGTNGEPVLEDTTCAVLGAKLAEAAGLGALTPAAVATAADVAAHLDDLPAMMRHSKHGQDLIALGFEADLDFCARRHVYSKPSMLKGDRIINI